jgi:hypothetical protein
MLSDHYIQMHKVMLSDHYIQALQDEYDRQVQQLEAREREYRALLNQVWRWGQSDQKRVP